MIGHPRNRQPSYPVRLLDSIEGFAVGGSILPWGAQNCGNNVLTLAGGIQTFGTSHGLAWKGDATDNIAWATLNRPFVLATDTEMTFICTFRKNGAAADVTTIAGYGSTGGGAGNTLFRIIGGAASATAIRVQVQDAAGTVAYNTDSSGIAVNNGLVHTTVIPFSLAGGGTLEYYIDGTLCGTVARASAVAATTFNSVNACASIRGGTAVGFGNWEVLLFVTVFGKISAETSRRISLNPWGYVFPPQYPGYVWEAAGAPAFTIPRRLTLLGVGA